MSAPILLSLAAGYLLGSIPFGLLLTRFSGRGDLRDIGSGNIGATNVLRTGSKPLAALTVVLDAGKGAVAVMIAQQYWPDGIPYAAAGALIGHLYPVWLRFRGGKGAATLFGILVPLLPAAALIYALVWIGLLLVLRFSSVASMGAATSAPVTAAVAGASGLLPMFLGFAILVIWKHHENIRRLLAGTEPRVGQSSPEPAA